MKYKILQLNERVECCFVYIDTLSDELKNDLQQHFLEIVNGKLEAERAKGDNKALDSALEDAAKFIYEKKGSDARVGIIGELLFHIILRKEELSCKYFSALPTIGYSDCYSAFFKGFDGCYYYQDSIWISEIKSKLSTNTLDADNSKKIKLASKQIKDEAKDKTINRWERAKKMVYHQLNELQRDTDNIFKLLQKAENNNYNQMLGAFLICGNGDFSKEHIETYVDKLYHEGVNNQRILMVCMRSFDFEKIIDYIANEIGQKSQN